MDVTDGGRQVGAHSVDVVQQALALGTGEPDVAGQVAVGDMAHHLRRVARVAAQTAGDIADHQAHQQGQRQAHRQQRQQVADQRLQEGRIDVVDVDPGADHPAPGGVVAVEGGLLGEAALLLVGPEIVDEAVVLVHRLHELAEQISPLLVLEVADEGAHRQARVGQQLIGLVEDVDVAATLVVGHVAHHGGRHAPGLGLVQLAIGHALGLAGDGVHRHVDAVTQRHLAFGQHGLAVLPGSPADQQQHGQPNHPQQPPELLRRRQSLHASLGRRCYE